MRNANGVNNDKSTPSGKSILVMDNISVSFDGFKALNKLSFIVMAGEMRAIIGPNGAGKTTMMDVNTIQIMEELLVFHVMIIHEYMH